MTDTPPTLSYTRLQGTDAPARWMLVLHGILGSKSNWRAIVRQTLLERPRWGAILVDLRMHGASMGFAPPHTLAAVSNDLVALSQHLDLSFDAVLGHSFGGKVALQHTHDTLGAARAVIVVDASPGPRPDRHGSELVVHVVDTLDSLGTHFASRAEFVSSLTARNVTPDIAAWLSMNLAPAPNGFTLRLDLRAIHAMLLDYFAQDLWPIVEDPPGRAHLHLVIAGRSTVYSEADRARAEALAAMRPDAIAVHVIPEASHWVHASAPEAMHRVLRDALDDAP